MRERCVRFCGILVDTEGLRDRVAKRHVNQTVISRFLLKISRRRSRDATVHIVLMIWRSSHSRHATIETARGEAVFSSALSSRLFSLEISHWIKYYSHLARSRETNGSMYESRKNLAWISRRVVFCLLNRCRI